MNKHTGKTSLPLAASRQPVCPSVLTPTQVIQTYDDGQWEEFALEFLGATTPPYVLLERKGGAGDKGRDIVAHVLRPPAIGDIDIFQCKAYQHALMPTDIWIELGKLCVFTHRGDFRVPRLYRFVAPHGVGTKLGDLLAKPTELRNLLITNWSNHCELKISDTNKYALAGSLKKYVESFDFSIVGYIPVHELLEQHRKTPHWHQRFKRDFPVRPQADMPPTVPQPSELRYVEQLLGAYADHLKRTVPDVGALTSQPHLFQHLQRSRTEYFMADSLNRFYRDQFPAGAFEHIMTQIHAGVIDTAEASHPDGLARVRATVQSAASLVLSQTDYTPYVEPGDKKGVCHHLANDDKLRWTT